MIVDPRTNYHVGGWMDGWSEDGQTAGWTVGRTDRWIGTGNCLEGRVSSRVTSARKYPTVKANYVLCVLGCHMSAKISYFVCAELQTPAAARKTAPSL